MKNINILYIDDKPDEILSEYLYKRYGSKVGDYKGESYNTSYNELLFDTSKDYKNLINKENVKSANIIIIDNHLFQEHSEISSKFSGRQFKIILRKLFPYIEVIVITQDEELVGDKILKKFSGNDANDSTSYYDGNLAKAIDDSIKEVMEFEVLMKDLEQNEAVDKLLIDKIVNSVKGDNIYDDLSKEDIDEFINMFKDLKNELEKQ